MAHRTRLAPGFESKNAITSTLQSFICHLWLADSRGENYPGNEVAEKQPIRHCTRRCHASSSPLNSRKWQYNFSSDWSQLTSNVSHLTGAFVIGTTSTEAKAAKAREAGADEVILYSQKDFVEEVNRITEGKGVNAIYDGVGKTTFLKSKQIVISLRSPSRNSQYCCYTGQCSWTACTIPVDQFTIFPLLIMF